MRRPPHANGNKNIVPLLCALCYFLIAISGLPAVRAKGQAQATLATRNNAAPQSVIIDTDIGGDIDDVYAVALALHSPELRILGIMTEFVDTTLEARLASRFLKETGYSDIPVAVGTPKQLAAIVRRLVAEDEIDCDARCSDDLTEETAEVFGQIVGYAKLRELAAPAPNPQKGALEIQQIYVLRKWHGRGVAERLMHWALDRARTLGAPEIYLTVFDHNQWAKRFYTRHGFVEVGNCTFQLGNRIDDDRVWRKTL